MVRNYGSLEDKAQNMAQLMQSEQSAAVRAEHAMRGEHSLYFFHNEGRTGDD